MLVVTTVFWYQPKRCNSRENSTVFWTQFKRWNSREISTVSVLDSIEKMQFERKFYRECSGPNSKDAIREKILSRVFWTQFKRCNSRDISTAPIEKMQFERQFYHECSGVNRKDASIDSIQRVDPIYSFWSLPSRWIFAVLTQSIGSDLSEHACLEAIQNGEWFQTSTKAYNWMNFRRNLVDRKLLIIFNVSTISGIWQCSGAIFIGIEVFLQNRNFIVLKIGIRSSSSVGVKAIWSIVWIRNGSKRWIRADANAQNRNFRHFASVVRSVGECGWKSGSLVVSGIPFPKRSKRVGLGWGTDRGKKVQKTEKSENGWGQTERSERG